MPLVERHIIRRPRTAVKTISRAAEVGRGSRRLTPSRVVPDQVPSTKGPHGGSGSVERNGTSPSRGSGRGDTWNKRVTNEELVEAYRATGSIWKAAKRLGQFLVGYPFIPSVSPSTPSGWRWSVPLNGPGSTVGTFRGRHLIRHDSRWR